MLGTKTITTPAIASSAATITTEALLGFITQLVVDVRESDGSASSNSADVAITDSLGRTLFDVSSISGVGNPYFPSATLQTNAGVTTDPDGYTYFFLGNNNVTVTIANGTDTEYVQVHLLMNPYTHAG